MAIIPVRRKKGTTYKVMVRDPHGSFYDIKVFDKKSDAKAYESDLIMGRVSGRSAPTSDAKKLTYDQLYEMWKVRCRTKVSEGWAMSQDQMHKDHISPVIGDMVASRIERDDIQRVLTTAATNKLGPQMQIHIYRQLSKVFRDAIEEMEVLNRLSPVRESLKPDAPQVVRKFLKAHTAWQFLAKIKRDHVATPIWIMMLTGMRVGEVMALKWANVDFRGEKILVEEQWNRKVGKFTPVKNRRAVWIPMLPDLIEYMQSVIPDDVDPDAYVCTNLDGGMIAYDTIYDGLKRLCKAHKVESLSPHELRHTTSEIWIDFGATEQDIKNLFNHKHTSSTAGYIHKTDERLARLAKESVKTRPAYLRSIK